MTPTTATITVNFAPIAMIASECDAAPEPAAVNYQNSEFIRHWESDVGLDMETVIAEFEKEWSFFEMDIRRRFPGLLVFQRSIVTSFPIGEAAVIVSAEKYATRSCSVVGTLSRGFARNEDGLTAFKVSLVDHPGETRPVPLSEWLRQGIEEMKWCESNTYFLGARELVRD